MDYAAKDVHVCCEAKGLLGQTVQTKKNQKAAVTHYKSSEWTNRQNETEAAIGYKIAPLCTQLLDGMTRLARARSNKPQPKMWHVGTAQKAASA